MVVANRSPRVDSWLNRLQSRAFHSIVGGRERPAASTTWPAASGSSAARWRKPLPLYGDLHRFIPALALREGYRVDEVAVPQHPNDARTRVYRPGVYLRRLLDIAAFFFLAKFTEKPLRFFGLVGSVFFGLGAVTSLVLLVERIAGQGIAESPPPAPGSAAGRPGRAAHGSRPGGRDHRAPPVAAPSGVSGARAGLTPRAGRDVRRRTASA